MSNIKVELIYQVEVPDGHFEDIPGGIYYTDTWDSNSASSVAVVTCFDRLYTISQIENVPFAIRRGVTFREAFVQLFNAAGLKNTEYHISTQINGTLDYFWATDNTVVSNLSTLALYTGCNVYVDKRNTIRVVPADAKTPVNFELSDSNLIISVKSTPAYTNMYSAVKVNYSKANINATRQLYKNDELIVKAGMNVLSDIVLESSPVITIDSIVITAPEGVSLVSYGYTDKTATLSILNNLPTNQAVQVVLYGSILNSIQDSVYVLNDEIGINNTLEVTIPIPCSSQYATQYAQKLLATFSSITSTIEIEMRGFPPLELSDAVLVNSPTSATVNTFCVSSIDTKFADGLSSNVKLRIVGGV